MKINSKELLLILLLITGCNKEEILFENLVKKVELSKASLKADGKDVLKVTLFFNIDAEISKISGKASINNAIFQESKTNKLDLKPIKTINNEIIAEFIITSTTLNSDHALVLNVNEFEKRFEIQSIKSVPASISLETSSFSVGEDFSDEIKLVATLKNEEEKSVSNGAKVVFMDLYDDGTSVNGVFRDEQLSSNNESKTSAFYTPGIVSGNQFINIKAEVLDSLGNLSGIIDTKRIFITTN